MALDLLRLAEHAHGHLGWLAAAALAHPAIVLRRRAGRSNLVVALSSAFVTVASAIGALLYGPYRGRLKHDIFVEAERFGWLFERKEHVAFGAVVLAWGGAAAYVAARRAASDEARTHLLRAAQRAFACACALALVAAVLGTIVASYRTF